jgi:hypothetical protein
MSLLQNGLTHTQKHWHAVNRRIYAALAEAESD